MELVYVASSVTRNSKVQGMTGTGGKSSAPQQGFPYWVSEEPLFSARPKISNWYKLDSIYKSGLSQEKDMIPWNVTKAKVQLRLSVQRLKTLQQKKEAQAKAARREIAALLERGKEETSRIKVEALINEDIYTELLELLELYCELLLARFGLLDQNTREPDPGISESVCSIIHAAPRTEVKELHVLREILMHKYNRDISLAAIENRDNCVSERIVRKLATHPPSSELVDAYLVEIAKGYGISWGLEAISDDEKVVKAVNPSTEVLDNSVNTVAQQDMPSDDLEVLMKRLNALKQR